MTIEPSILDYLGDLEGAVANLANTWRPDDPAYRADVYRQTMTSLSYSYFAYFHADAEHPDWAPLWNPVYTLQPNPDDIYLSVADPRRPDLSGSAAIAAPCKILTFTTQTAHVGHGRRRCRSRAGTTTSTTPTSASTPGEDFEVIFSAERPAGYTGNWAPIDPEAGGMMVRYRSYDWANEVDPLLSIECLDPVPPKPRLTPEEILHAHPARWRNSRRARPTSIIAMQNGVKERVGFNVFEPIRMPGALAKQVYWPACFQFDADEALIIETEMPERAPYWNIQLNDPYFNALEYVYRLSSTNGAMAKLSSDGKFRAVIALEDPGVPNWLDPAGYTEGGIYGRWYDCDSEPDCRSIKRVKLAELRDHLPADTPVVTPEERAEELRQRVRACQRRRRW